MLIRIEDRIIGTVEIAVPDNAAMGKIIAAIRQAVAIFSVRYDTRDRSDFLAILGDDIKNLRETEDDPAHPL